MNFNFLFLEVKKLKKKVKKMKIELFCTNYNTCLYATAYRSNKISASNIPVWLATMRW